MLTRINKKNRGKKNPLGIDGPRGRTKHLLISKMLKMQVLLSLIVNQQAYPHPEDHAQ